MSKLLILDKDFTLIYPASGATFVQHPRDQALLPGIAETIAHYHAEGWTIVIASNQDGCSAINPQTGNPYKTLDDAYSEMCYCLSLLPQVEYALFCPDIEGRMCELVDRLFGCENKMYQPYMKDSRGFRKPDPEMLQLAIQNFTHPDGLHEVLMVGDQAKDQLAAQAVGVKFMWAEEWQNISKVKRHLNEFG